jgi:hypothetical protein
VGSKAWAKAGRENNGSHEEILMGKLAIMKPNRIQNLERVLESAVVVSWADLTRGGRSGLVHIEYGFSPSGTLDYLQVWSSIRRGYWLLACSYWMSPSQLHDSGVHFDNGYQSEGLAHILQVVMQHQSAFSLPPNLGRQGLLQITTPTEIESMAAAASMRDVSDCAGSALTETPLATS